MDVRFVQPIEDCKTLIDLDELGSSALEIVYEWDAEVRRFMGKYAIPDTEQNLNTIMKEYIKSLEQVFNFEDIEMLQEKMLQHIHFFYWYYTELKYCFVDIYLENMEDILTFYCNLEIRVLLLLRANRKFKKFMLPRVNRRLIHILSLYLLHKEYYIYHVLIRLTTNDANSMYKEISNIVNSTVGKFILRTLYKHFLVNHPAQDLSDEAYCRIYILFQNWKSIEAPVDAECVQTIFGELYKKTPDVIDKSEVLKSILKPQNTNKIIHILMGYIGCNPKILEAYFEYIKSKKKIDSDLFDSNLELGSDCTNLIEDPEDEQDCDYMAFIRKVSDMSVNVEETDTSVPVCKTEDVDCEIIDCCSSDDDIEIISVLEDREVVSVFRTDHDIAEISYVQKKAPKNPIVHPRRPGKSFLESIILEEVAPVVFGEETICIDFNDRGTKRISSNSTHVPESTPAAANTAVSSLGTTCKNCLQTLVTCSDSGKDENKTITKASAIPVCDKLTSETELLSLSDKRDTVAPRVTGTNDNLRVPSPVLVEKNNNCIVGTQSSEIEPNMEPNTLNNKNSTSILETTSTEIDVSGKFGSHLLVENNNSTNTSAIVEVDRTSASEVDLKSNVESARCSPEPKTTVIGNTEQIGSNDSSLSEMMNVESPKLDTIDELVCSETQMDAASITSSDIPDCAGAPISKEVRSIEIQTDLEVFEEIKMTNGDKSTKPVEEVVDACPEVPASQITVGESINKLLTPLGSVVKVSLKDLDNGIEKEFDVNIDLNNRDVIMNLVAGMPCVESNNRKTVPNVVTDVRDVSLCVAAKLEPSIENNRAVLPNMAGDFVTSMAGVVDGSSPIFSDGSDDMIAPMDCVSTGTFVVLPNDRDVVSLPTTCALTNNSTILTNIASTACVTSNPAIVNITGKMVESDNVALGMIASTRVVTNDPATTTTTFTSDVVDSTFINNNPRIVTNVADLTVASGPAVLSSFADATVLANLPSDLVMSTCVLTDDSAILTNVTCDTVASTCVLAGTAGDIVPLTSCDSGSLTNLDDNTLATTQCLMPNNCTVLTNVEGEIVMALPPVDMGRSRRNGERKLTYDGIVEDAIRSCTDEEETVDMDMGKLRECYIVLSQLNVAPIDTGQPTVSQSVSKYDDDKTIDDFERFLRNCDDDMNHETKTERRSPIKVKINGSGINTSKSKSQTKTDRENVVGNVPSNADVTSVLTVPSENFAAFEEVHWSKHRYGDRPETIEYDQQHFEVIDYTKSKPSLPETTNILPKSNGANVLKETGQVDYSPSNSSEYSSPSFEPAEDFSRFLKHQQRLYAKEAQHQTFSYNKNAKPKKSILKKTILNNGSFCQEIVETKKKRQRGRRMSREGKVSISKESLNAYKIKANDHKLNSFAFIYIDAEKNSQDMKTWMKITERSRINSFTECTLVRVDFDKTTTGISKKDTTYICTSPKSAIQDMKTINTTSRFNTGTVNSHINSANETVSNDDFCLDLTNRFSNLNCNVNDALNLTLPCKREKVVSETDSEFSNSPNFLQDSEQLVQHCLQDTTDCEAIPNMNLLPTCQEANFLSNNSNFYCHSLLDNIGLMNNLNCNLSRTESLSLNSINDNTHLPTAVPETYDFELNNRNEIFKVDINNLESEFDFETHLPLKKRRLTVTNEINKEEISYPATPMISIAEVEALHCSKLMSAPRSFKTPAERKEMPPLPKEIPQVPIFCNEITDPSQFNINTYNNPTINYHMNNLPVPFINISCGSYYPMPPILLPMNNMPPPYSKNQMYNQPDANLHVKKEKTRKSRSNRRR